jgi:hypothetical protein
MYKLCDVFAICKVLFIGFVLQGSVAMAESVPNKSAQKYKLDGFRSANFGQSQKAVLLAIKNDFGISAKNVKKHKNSKDKTTILTIKVKALSPFLVDGNVHYVFGYKTRKLMQVNVVWVSDAKTKQGVSAFTASAIDVLSYYSRFDLSNYNVVQGRAIKNGILLMAAVSKQSPYSTVEFILKGVKVSQDSNKLDVDVIKGEKPTVSLRYIKDLKNMDVFTLKKGDF